MREIRIQFAYDYVDPGSYVVEHLLLRWLEEAEGGVEIERIPLELRPPPGPLLEPDEPGWSAMTEALAEEAGRLGIPFRVPRFIPRSRKAHELALHAEERGCFPRVHGAIFEAHFLRGEDLGRVDVLVEIARREELDPSEVRAVLGVDRFLPAAEEARRRAIELGFRGVPVLACGEDRLEGYEGDGPLLSFLERAATREPGGRVNE